MTLAHAGTTAGGVEIELLLLGAGFLAAAWFFRPSETGNARSAVVCLLIGIALVTGSVAIPRLGGDGSRPSDAHVEIVAPEEGGDVASGQPVNIEVDLTHGTLATSPDAQAGGHMHLYVDGELRAMPYSLKAQTTFEPGEHTIMVEYVDLAHRAFDPPVQDEVTVTAR